MEPIAEMKSDEMKRTRLLNIPKSEREINVKRSECQSRIKKDFRIGLNRQCRRLQWYCTVARQIAKPEEDLKI